MTRVDLYLLLTAIIWGSNYSVIKFVLQEVPPRTFNALRLSIASAVFLVVIYATRRREHVARLTARDWAVVLLLGVIGQFGYQMLFIAGLERTSVMNASIIIACTPATVSIASAAVGHERLPLPHWLGTALSFVGVSLIVAGGAAAGVSSPSGDLMMVACVLCWTVYTVAGRPLLATYSPLVITGLSMAIGTALFLPFSIPDFARTHWADVRTRRVGVRGLFVAAGPELLVHGVVHGRAAPRGLAHVDLFQRRAGGGAAGRRWCGSENGWRAFACSARCSSPPASC